MEREETLAALIEACHRALDELDRLDMAKPVIGVCVGAKYDKTTRCQGLFYRWTSPETGNAEERCHFIGLAPKIAFD